MSDGEEERKPREPRESRESRERRRGGPTSSSSSSSSRPRDGEGERSGKGGSSDAAQGGGDDGGSGGNGDSYSAYILMDSLLDKLKLLDYDTEFCQKKGYKPLSRHYFAASENASEQLWVFAGLVIFLLEAAGESTHGLQAPEQFADPHSTTTSLVSLLKKSGIQTDVSQTKLKTGAGEEVCQILNTLAQMALKAKRWKWSKPEHKSDAAEAQEEDVAQEEDIAQQVSAADGDEIEEEEFGEEDEAFIDVDSTKVVDTAAVSKQEDVLLSQFDAAEWRLEVERVAPHLKVHIRADAKDWRSHITEMQDHSKNIEVAMTNTHSQLEKLQNEIGKTMEKISSREKYINSQLEGLIQEYRMQQDTLAGTTERYRQASTGVTELSKTMANLTEQLESVKTQMDERGSSMTDAQPLVKIKQALTRVKTEIGQMELRMGVVQHVLLAAKVRDKGDHIIDFHANPVAMDPIVGGEDW